MNIQPNIDEATDMLKDMLERRPISFSAPTLNIPDKGGIYLFSNKHTNEPLYAGRSQKGIRSRLKDHWSGITSSDLSGKLVKEGLADDVRAGRRWIEKNVKVRWLTDDEFDMDIKFAEYFVIGVLRPPFNG